MVKQIERIAVVGAGIMGHGIAQVCAQTGKPVVLTDSFPEVLQSARMRIEKSVAMLRAEGLLSPERADGVMRHLSFTPHLDEAVRSADLVFEVIPEKAEFKKPLFEQLDRLCRPDVVVASNTSAIPIHLLAEFSRHPERVIGAHFYNPAQLIPLVEVITAERTSAAALRLLMEFLTAAGKKPIHVCKDIPGFIGNRLQHALAREAMSLLQKGVASAEDIDAVVKHSLALRLLFSGPLEQRDLNGLDTHLAVTQTLYPDLEDAKEPLRVLSEKVAKGDLGLKTGKGFYDWSAQEAADVTKNKNRQLVILLKLLRANSFEEVSLCKQS
jgi:3-hydroxybutyryl-CoA dehydrogenase